ncbi:ras guanyl-releasing protein 3-like isoform X2 [Centruroides sculpturatus]|uniref:ras guanyl-releasing protein 3-like isoform X2 n=1 Tax=Centruroides sculpturatus TaxID=218467 RepID=UPI000C6CE99D|nr:ras guanyl-releasing protein 3-like isoform X2 [Centruroides sculpturatus]
MMTSERRTETMPSRSLHKVASGENTHVNSIRSSWLTEMLKSNSKEVVLEDRPAACKIMVKAASLDVLIHLLVHSFMPIGGLEKENDNFPRIMLLMHQWFVSSEELAQKLINLFWNCDTAFTCHPKCTHSLKNVIDCQIYRYRARISQTFRYWIFTFSIHFDQNRELSSILLDFQQKLQEKGFSGLAELVDLSKLPSYDWTRNISVRNPPAKHTRKVSLVFDHLEAGELAEHLTYLEHKVMRRITFLDFKAYAQSGTLQDNAKLERSIALFNGLSQWIQCMVLSRSLAQQRADVITKFVSVAKKLLQLQNFNSLMAVVGGLSHSALARLTRTMAAVPSETIKSLEELTDLLSSASNFTNYRKALAESKGFRIPILGVHMKDLISLQVALPDTLDNGLINFRKIVQLSLIFQELWELQNSTPSLSVNLDLVNTLRFLDFKAYAQSGTLQDNAKLERSIALFNGLSQWIQCMVLSRSLAQQRADVITKFVSVAKKLLQLQNFNSLMAVVGGLSHSALARLTRTMAAVPSETIKSLEELTDLLSSASNFTNYRKALAESKGFRIPILGVHMKDLISLQVALPDTLDNGLINFRKIVQLSLIFQELWELQNSTPSLSVNLDLVNTLRLSVETAYTEDELYELSLSREPRNPTSPQSSPTKPIIFAEWATGSCIPPEPEVLEKHIDSIVEAIFKNYDIDKDGYISPDEYDAIVSNFPFIDAFCIVDANQDGMISKEEMKKYFLQANSRTLRTIFQHDFHETTYFRPTFCARCTGLLWGLIKQGYKCRDCGINAHKHCKDLVVIECRRISCISPRANSFAGTDGITIKSRFQRHWKKQPKTSQSEESTLSPRTSTESCNCENGFITIETPTDEIPESINYEVNEDETAELIENNISMSVSRDLSISSSKCRCRKDVYSPKSPMGNGHAQSNLVTQPNS